MIASEQALHYLNSAIAESPCGPLASDVPPILFICGAPRAGTTLVCQALVHGGNMGCINNLVARFFKNPVLGVRLVQALDLPSTFTGKSEFGRTSGLTEPHEFGRGWLDILGLDCLAQPAGETVLPSTATERIAQIGRAWEKPVVLKSFAYLWFIETLAEALPGSLWLHLTRDPAANADSLSRLYCARGADDSPERWESAVCRSTMSRMRGKSLAERALAQVSDINSHISVSLSRLPAERTLKIGFEDFVSRMQNSTEMVLRHFNLPNSPEKIAELPR